MTESENHLEKIRDQALARLRKIILQQVDEEKFGDLIKETEQIILEIEMTSDPEEVLTILSGIPARLPVTDPPDSPPELWRSEAYFELNVMAVHRLGHEARSMRDNISDSELRATKADVEEIRRLIETVKVEVRYPPPTFNTPFTSVPFPTLKRAVDRALSAIAKLLDIIRRKLNSEIYLVFDEIRGKAREVWTRTRVFVSEVRRHSQIFTANGLNAAAGALEKSAAIMKRISTDFVEPDDLVNGEKYYFEFVVALGASDQNVAAYSLGSEVQNFVRSAEIKTEEITHSRKSWRAARAQFLDRTRVISIINTIIIEFNEIRIEELIWISVVNNKRLNEPLPCKFDDSIVYSDKQHLSDHELDSIIDALIEFSTAVSAMLEVFTSLKEEVVLGFCEGDDEIEIIEFLLNLRIIKPRLT